MVFWVVNSLMSVYTAVFTISYAIPYHQEPIELLIQYGCLNLTPVYTRKLYSRTHNTVRCRALDVEGFREPAAQERSTEAVLTQKVKSRVQATRL